MIAVNKNHRNNQHLLNTFKSGTILAPPFSYSLWKILLGNVEGSSYTQRTSWGWHTPILGFKATCQSFQGCPLWSLPSDNTLLRPSKGWRPVGPCRFSPLLPSRPYFSLHSKAHPLPPPNKVREQERHMNQNTKSTFCVAQT